MSINQIKTKHVSFSRSRNPVTYSYKLNLNSIENVSSFKYLGVHLSHDLSWKTHVENIASNAFKTSGFLKRHLHQTTPQAKQLSYCPLVSSKLEYASTIWNPHQTYLSKMLETIQSRATRFILHDYPPMSITALKASISLPPLKDRRALLTDYLFLS